MMIKTTRLDAECDEYEAEIQRLRERLEEAETGRKRILKDRNALLDQLDKGPLSSNEWQIRSIRAEKRLEKCEAALKAIYEIATQCLAAPMNESGGYLVEICNTIEDLDAARAVLEDRA